MNSTIKISIYTAIATMVLFATACSKSKSCYSEDLYQKHKNDACTEEWRNVLGCDGKRYGNECQANSVGIFIR